MMRENFFQDLEFYDKSHLKPSVYKALSRYVKMPEFDPDLIAQGSKAAYALCKWVHSVFKYAEIYKQIAPKLAKLMQAEEELTKVCIER